MHANKYSKTTTLSKKQISNFPNNYESKNFQTQQNTTILRVFESKSQIREGRGKMGNIFIILYDDNPTEKKEEEEWF